PALAAGDREPPVRCASRYEHRPAADELPIVELQPVYVAFARHRTDVDRGDDLRSKLERLEISTIRQVGPGQALGESQVILDPRTGAGLAAGTESIDDQGAQPLRRAVDCRRQSGGSGPNDDEVEWLGPDPALEPDALGNPGDRRSRCERAAGARDDRRL